MAGPEAAGVRSWPVVGAGIVLVLALLAAAPSPQAPAPSPQLEDEARAIARELQCPVCQGLSVADSPSQLASQMRETIRAKLAAGESRDQVLAYFAERYGEEVLLSPPRQGFTGLVWIAPYLALVAAIGFVVWTVRRRPFATEDDVQTATPDVDRFLPEVDRTLGRLRDEPLR